MSSNPATSTVMAMRPFLPTKDFAISRHFYEALGFQVSPIDDKVALVRIHNARGSFSFLLQDFYVKEFAENAMMFLLVDDVEGWWRHIAAQDLEARFATKPPSPPKDETWGMRVAYVWDPAGVLWHIAADL